MKIAPWILIVLLLPGCALYKTTVHEYNYRAQPAPTPPGTPPPPPPPPPPPRPSATAVVAAPPVLPVPPVPYRTVYESAWDDPTLVVFVSLTARTVRLKIDDKPEIRLAGYQATADLSLGVGEHKIRLTYEKSTADFGILEVVRIFPPQIRPDGRSQSPIYIYDQ